MSFPPLIGSTFLSVTYSGHPAVTSLWNSDRKSFLVELEIFSVGEVCCYISRLVFCDRSEGVYPVVARGRQ